MPIINNIPVWGEPLPEAVSQMTLAMSSGACYGALMADHHLGYSVPVGGVIAYENSISPNAVGFDIACGNLAVRLDCDEKRIKQNIKPLMDLIYKELSFGVGRTNNEKVEHPLFDEVCWGQHPILAEQKDRAISQLGTIGSGNHYVDLFRDERGRIWVGVHFGSRGLGHTICTHFLKRGGGKDGINAPPVVFDENSELGEAYLHCMDIAGKYAYAGREWVCQKVASLLDGVIVESVHNHHNFAWKETHFGKSMWVIRKGATPAFPGQKGFVGGSMGDISVILEGLDSPQSALGLYSTIHGAGRAMGRNEARGKICRKTGNLLTKGKVDQHEHDRYIAQADVEVRGGDLDESPLAYKRIESVLHAHEPTINIIHTLRPIGVCMAPRNERDPYKD